MNKFLVYSHVLCGGIVLLLGIVNMLNRKGSANHKLTGKIYVAAMWWICLSSVLIISFYRFSGFLLVIAMLTFHASFVGVRVLKRRVPGQEKWYDWAVSIITATFGIGLLIYGISIFFKIGGFHTLGMLCVIFGVFTSANGINDLRFFLWPRVDTKEWWLYEHISAMSGSYIAAVTAFAVQNGNAFLPETYSYMSWALWVLPGIVGSPFIAMTIRKYKVKRMVIG